VLLKLAWRNIWRNKRRTIISLLALSLGVMAIVSLHSFQEVAYREMIRSLTSGLVGHAQVHGRGYQESPEVGTVVSDPRTVETRLVAAVPGASAELRVTGVGLGGSTEVASTVMVMGIEPDNPKAKALLTIEKGRGLGATPAHEAVIGTGLADELRLAPGDELVLVGQAADGSLANDRFTVVGTADAGSWEASSSAVFLHLADAQSFFSLGESVHQIVVRLPVQQEDLSQPMSLLRAALDQNALEVLPWTEIFPDLKSAIDAKRRNSRLIDLIVFLIVSLGVLNTMTMSTFERTREFGVLASLGTRPRRILAMVALETFMQGLIGFAAGLCLAYGLLYGIGTADISSMGGNMDVLGARLPGALQLSVNPGAVLSAAVATALTMLAGGLIPVIRASRLKPVEATRYV
jgi:ABC-type lipoprotein release transport system permease subunit